MNIKINFIFCKNLNYVYFAEHKLSSQQKLIECSNVSEKLHDILSQLPLHVFQQELPKIYKLIRAYETGQTVKILPGKIFRSEIQNCGNFAAGKHKN